MERSQDDGFPDAPIRHCPACMQTLPANSCLTIDKDNGVLDVRPNTREEAREAVEEARQEGGGPRLGGPRPVARPRPQGRP
eukprot:11188074-Lingulodinium_polyedra.AAC.1